MTPVLKFQTSGALREGTFYVERRADHELFNALHGAQYCYVLAPRQIGKSSLRVRVSKRLVQDGVRCTTLDLSRYGSPDGAEQWYFSLIDDLSRGLGLREDPNVFWGRHSRTTPVHRLGLFLRNEVLDQIDGPVVIFLDEIDYVLQLPFSADDFFAALRALYNARADDEVCSRLSFCLIGVVSPAELIQAPKSTPFNIGQSIPLEDFQPGEAGVFLAGLAGLGTDPQRLLDAVLAWTDGHPCMTHLLCAELSRRGEISADRIEEHVAALVTESYLRPGRADAMALSYPEQRFKANPVRRRSQMMRLYRRLLEGELVPAEIDDDIQMSLRLTGMVAERSGWQEGRCLRVRNRIFASVFDQRWAREHDEDRLLTESLLRWQESGQSNDYILRGHALEDALSWMRGRRDVTPEEREFLFRSQEVYHREQEERRQTEEALLIERAARATTLVQQSPGTLEALLLSIQAVGESLAKGRPPLTPAVAALAAASMAGGYPLLSLAHSNAVTSVAFTPCGERLITACADETVRVWSARDGREVKCIPIHQLGAEPVATCSPSGHFLTVSGGRISGVWSVKDGRCHFLITEHTDVITSATFSPDSQLLLTTSQDETARVWDARTGQRLAVMRGHTLGSLWGAFSPDGQMVVTTDREKQARLWHARTGEIYQALRGHAGPVLLALFSPDGRQVVTAARDRMLRIWDVHNGERPQKSFSHPELINAVVFSPDGRKLATACKDQTARVIDASTGQLLLTLKGHLDNVSSVCFSADGQHLLTASWDGTAHLWDTGTGRSVLALRGHQGPLLATAMSPEGSRVATAGKDRITRVWQVRARWNVVLRGHAERVYAVAYAPGGARVATAAGDGLALLWNARTGQRLMAFAGHHGPVLGVAFSPDGRYLATAGDDHMTLVWDVQSGVHRWALAGHEARVRSVAYSPNGTQIVSGGDDKTVRVWDLRDGKERLALRGHDGWVAAAVFSPDGRRILSASYDRTARVWDAETGALLCTFSGHQGWVLSATFSPDGARVISAGFDNTIRIWDSQSGVERQILGGHTQGIWSVGISPDGTRLVTAGGDKKVRVWDVQAGQVLFTFADHPSATTAAALAPDGAYVVVASADTARIYPASVSVFLCMACALLRHQPEYAQVAEYCQRCLED